MKHQKNRTLQTTSSRHKQTNHNDLTQLKDGNWLVCRVDKRQSLFSDDKSSLKWDYSRRSIYTIHYLNNRQILLLCFCHLIHRKGCKKKKKEKKTQRQIEELRTNLIYDVSYLEFFSITSQIFLKSGLFSVNFETESSLVPS